MATTRNLAQLFRALADKDVIGAASIATQICKSEEQKGHRSAARLLRGALHANGTNGAHTGNELSFAAMNGSSLVAAALARLPTDVDLKHVILATGVRRELDAVVIEWSKRDSLREHGLTPRSKLLFHGPPGCGKSLSARALGKAMGIPAYVVRFDAVIGAYLGQTALHLRQLFNFAETNPCILLLDELDALGKRRGNPLDVGELDRVVVALLQELEHSRPQGLVIGTSNLAKHLDDALWRRFDLTLEFKTPSHTALSEFAKRVASEKQIKLPAMVLRRATQAGNFADAESLVVAEARRQVLKGL
ncbi:MAG: AAA family ATPase [Planctomycetes bacterium]|nr:AAA family ATPase [Planctomycetota bacterium]